MPRTGPRPRLRWALYAYGSRDRWFWRVLKCEIVNREGRRYFVRWIEPHHGLSEVPVLNVFLSRSDAENALALRVLGGEKSW